MNRTILAALAGAALSASAAQIASAADIPAPVYKVAPAMIVASTWTGIYVGGNAGYGWGRNSLTNNGPNSLFEPVGTSDDLRPGGGLVGGQIGFNWQMGSVVLGVEAMGAAAWMKETKQSIFFPRNDIWSSEYRAFYSLTARLGWAAGAFLPYVKGGFASALIKSGLNDITGVQSVEFDNWHYGWTAGAGIEYMITNNWILGAEYNYYDFGARDLTSTDTAGVVQNYNTKAILQTVTGRLSYKF